MFTQQTIHSTMNRNELQMQKRINLIHIIVKWPDKNEYILCNSIKFKKKKPKTTGL